MVKKKSRFQLLYKKWEFLALGLLCSILLLSHTFYVIKTHQFPAGGIDEPVYLSMAVYFYDQLKTPSIETVSTIFDFNRYRQPLYGVFLSLPLLLFGTFHTYKIALWMNVIFYIMSIIATYFLGREFLSKKASILASFIFAFNGFALFYLHFTYSETAVTSFILLALLFLARSKNFFLTKPTIFFSIFFMVGNLIRWIVPIFTLGSIIISLVFGLTLHFSQKRNLSRIILNLGLFFLIGVLPLLLLYYIPNFSFFSTYITAQKAQEIEWSEKWLGPQFGNLFSIQSLVFYIKIFAQQTIYFFVLFGMGFILGLINFKRYAFLLLTFIIAYCILTLSTTWKGDRFIVPIYPVMAIFSAIVFDFVKNKRFGTILIILTLLIGTLNFLGASWGIGPMKFSVNGDKFTVPHSILVPVPFRHPLRVWLAPISWPPRTEESNAYQIVNAIRKDWGNDNQKFRLLQAFEMSQLGDGLYSIFSFEQRNVIEGLNILEIPKGRYDIFFQRIKNTDYILIKNGIIDKGYKEGTDKSWDNFIIFLRKFNAAINIKNNVLPGAFREVKKIYIPFDKSTLRIYRKTRKITPEEWKTFAEAFKKIDKSFEENIQRALEKEIGTFTN